MTLHPREIGPYLVEKQIGKGGMGTVYLGHHRESGNAAAVKVLPASFAAEEGFVARFSREIEAMKMVESPNIVDFFESGGGENDTYFYAMEYVKGETLTGLLRRVRRLTWQQAVHYSMQIAAALQAVHAAGIVHRDLKPSNLMVSSDGAVKLTDFGVAHLSGSGTRLTRTGGVIGTAEFMSPEQARGVTASKASDLYSLGTVMYAMLTGRPPFTGKNAADVIHKQQYHQPDKPSRYVSGVPMGLEMLVLRLLEKRPERRPEDASQIIRELNLIRQSMEREYETDVTMDGDQLLADASAPTQASNVHDLADADSDVANIGPGEGTIMQRMLRHKLRTERTDQESSGLLNNTWFLVAVLLILLYTAYAFLGRPGRSTDQIIADAKTTLQNPPGSSWLTAKAELEELTEPDERKLAEPLLERIEQWEQSQAIRRFTLRMPVPGSEAERVLMKAQSLLQAGNVVEAETLLEALVQLVNGDPRYEEVEKLAHKTLRRARVALEAYNKSRITFFHRMMDRAEGLRKSDPGAARRILEALVTVYSADKELSEQVQTCEQILLEFGPAEPQSSGNPADNDSEKANEK